MERIKFNQIPKEMVEKLMGIEKYLKESTLDFQLLELMRLRVAQINKCTYCIDMHYKELRHKGETELRLSTISVWNNTSFFTEKERVVLKFTEALTELSEKDISDDIFNALTKYFNTEEICNITFAVSQINTWTRLVRTFKLPAGNYKVQK
ncbi:carboxymuconolactone decarboxylase family protein [Psychroserpens damuponensis]|uniref:carboxymuconolactone decarboxylase family protein n=1 Tax=Psychroserpens damuponensis TaxID=943936 RepID=UPI000694682F|nr:carboxymuconolactone decarboxylase family protein [Psychroserpens damuponensis]